MNITHVKTCAKLAKAIYDDCKLWLSTIFLIMGMLGNTSTAEAEEIPQSALATSGGMSIEEVRRVGTMRKQWMYHGRMLSSTESQQSEIRWLALNMYHEAKGEDQAGWLAVARVTINRVHSKRYPGTIKAVVTQQNSRGCQFSWYCDGLRDVISHNDVALFQRMLLLAEEVVLYDAHPDATGGALHYYNAKKANPRWANGKVPSAIIGNHLFFNNVS